MIKQAHNLIAYSTVLRNIILFTFIFVFSCIKAQDSLNLKDTSTNGVYENADQMPEFEGGQEALFKYIYRNLKYPEGEEAQGRVYAKFVVSKTGEVKNIEILKSVSPKCDADAIRILESLPNWTPGIHKGEPVDVYMNLSINYRCPTKTEIKNDTVNKTQEEKIIPPQFVGGTEMLKVFVSKSLKYPKKAKKDGTKGRVSVTFTVLKSGKATNIKIKDSLSSECDAEAIRFVESLPDWTPGMLEGKPVDANYTLSLKFDVTPSLIVRKKARVKNKIGDNNNNPEVMPQFKGGLEALMRYIGENLRYPTEAAKAGIQGRVVVKFVITELGKVTNIEVKKGLSPECDAEAVRVVKSMPKWIPGMQDGKPVKVDFTIPISFILQY